MSGPVRHGVWVSCPARHAFRVFTEHIDAWWPPAHRTMPNSRLTLEARPGGRLFERDPDGHEADLGQVVRWEPPVLLAYTWRLGAPADTWSEVEVRFLDADGGTRVEVHHAAGRIGPEWPVRSLRFDASWTVVLPAFARFVDAG